MSMGFMLNSLFNYCDKENGLYLLLGMLVTVATCFNCSRPAFWERAVSIPTVFLAGLEPADYLVAAACNPAFTCTAAVFGTETFTSRGGAA